MAEIWRDGDSARLMTQKFNDLVREYDKLKLEYEGKLGTLPEVVEQLVEDMDKKLETVTKEDIGLGYVDNTPDLEKPVSAFQRNAINFAVREKLTSMPADYLGDGEDVDFQSWASENLATKDELEQKADKTENGATDSRPTGVSVGTCYFDTTLGKPIWYNGTDWVDSTGTTV